MSRWTKVVNQCPATAGGSVPNDPLALVRPGDPDPFFGRVGQCRFWWWDNLDDPAHDPPWNCHRDPGHLGHHIATDPGSHVAAVHP